MITDTQIQSIAMAAYLWLDPSAEGFWYAINQVTTLNLSEAEVASIEAAMATIRPSPPTLASIAARRATAEDT